MDFTAYLQTLSSAQRSRLFQSPWTSLAVLRNLPPLGQAYVSRLLYINKPFPKDLFEGWARRDALSSHREALAKLRSLDILHSIPLTGASAAAAAGGGQAAQGWILHPDFQTELQAIVCQGGTLMSGEVPRHVAAACPSPEQLDGWAASQWEQLQLLLLGVTARPPALPQMLASRCTSLDLRVLLVQAGLMAAAAKGGAGGGVTQRGFQFLLQPPERQLWAVLREYISGAEGGSGEELSSTLSFLLQLGFRRVGQPCPWADLQRGAEQQMAGNMVQLGLLAAFEAAGALYYTPTRLASSLCGGGGAGVMAAVTGGGGGTAPAAPAAGGVGGDDGRAGSGSSGAVGYIIVETNYRVRRCTPYTASPVAIAVLELFCRRDALLPNLFVGTITRDSILAALAKGITAEELVSYLQQRPHPNILVRSPVVPEVVTDQIRLWEASTKRIKADTAVLYENIETRQLFEQCAEFARRQGYLLWEDARSMRFAALESGHDAIKTRFGELKRELGVL